MTYRWPAAIERRRIVGTIVRIGERSRTVWIETARHGMIWLDVGAGVARALLGHRARVYAVIHPDMRVTDVGPLEVLGPPRDAVAAVDLIRERFGDRVGLAVGDD